jgi:hypothetical protein
MYRTREQVPSVQATKEGSQILCPFCKPTHPLAPSEPSSCGTILKLTAVQTIVPSRVARINKIVCVKCHQGGGDMVQYMSGYIHLIECDPKTRLLPTMPEFNWFAGLVFNSKIRQTLEKYTGIAQQVREIDQKGTETGKILGYFFLPKQKGMTNGSSG